MPATKIEVARTPKPLNLRETGHVGISALVHETVVGAIATWAEHNDSSSAEVIRTVLTDAYNSGRFDLPAE